MKSVLVPLANGFEDVEAVTIIDVLRRGNVNVITAALGTPTTQVRSAHGIMMTADALFDDILESPYDAIILPGGGEGTQNLKKSESLLERLRRQKSEGGIICAICAAPTVLELAGVIEEEHITCYPSCAPEMGHRIADVPVVADGQLVTGQGPASAMLFALVILSALASEQIAQQIANGLLAEL